MGWAGEDVEEVDLVDRRLNKRAIALLDTVVAKPTVSISSARRSFGDSMGKFWGQEVLGTAKFWGQYIQFAPLHTPPVPTIFGTLALERKFFYAVPEIPLCCPRNPAELKR